MGIVENLQGETLLKTAQAMVRTGIEIRTDGFKSYSRLTAHDCTVRSMNFDPEEAPEHLLWLHKVASNLKAFIVGTFHGLDKKHLQRYFDEFAYRFNRRKHESQIFARLLQACVSTNTITYKELIVDA